MASTPRSANNAFYKQLAARIKQAREAQELSIRETATQLGVTPGAVNQWEQPRTGTSPTLAMLSDLADLLDVSVGWLLGEAPRSRRRTAAGRKPTEAQILAVSNSLSTLRAVCWLSIGEWLAREPNALDEGKRPQAAKRKAR
jgi:transcriptional regulator with XRE-family HTH domain